MFQKTLNTKGAKMRWIAKLVALGMMVCIAQWGMVSPADAGQRSKQAKKMERKKQKQENRFEKRRKDRRIVMFSEWVNEDGRKAYLKEMKKRKIRLVKEMPYLNSAVLRVPRSISNDELAQDERVAAAVTNHKTRIKKGRKAERLRLRDADTGAELVYISGDGVSGDGGSGDGGSGDGGSGDGGSGDGGSGDGGSGDGGSGDGGSSLSPMFRIVDALGDAEKPWGVLDIYNLPYDPQWLTWQTDILLNDDYSDGLSGSPEIAWTPMAGATSGTPPAVLDDAGNLVISDGANSGGPVVTAGNWDDLIVSQDFRTINAGDTITYAGLVARVVDANNMVYGGISNKNIAEIYYRESGTWYLASQSWPISGLTVDDGNWHNQELRLTGDTVELYIDGVLIGSVSLAGTGLAAGTTGQAGFWSQAYNCEAYRDNYVVRDSNGDMAKLPKIIKTALNYSHKVSVAILDTGVNYNHPDLAGSITGGVDMAGTDSGIPMDNHGHGTHVAGTIVSPHAGVAPSKADIHAVRILNDDGSGEIATLLMGMEWAIENEMDIISMSVSYREDNPAVRQAVYMAHQYGIIMVSAAGNHSNWEDDDTSSGDGGSGDGGSGDGGSGDGGSGDGGSGDGGSGDGGSGDGGSGDPVGYDPSTGWYPVMYPAAYPEVIAVGAMDSWEAQASFSNDGPEVDVLAPGVDIMSTVGADSYALCNGTSMAAPHVTAAVVLIDSLAKKNKVDLTPDDIKTILGQSVNSNGAIDTEAALNMVETY